MPFGFYVISRLLLRRECSNSLVLGLAIAYDMSLLISGIVVMVTKNSKFCSSMVPSDDGQNLKKATHNTLQ